MGLQGDRHPADALLYADRPQRCVSRIRKVLPKDEATFSSALRLATAISGSRLGWPSTYSR